MERRDVLIASCIVGLVLMIAGFAGYVSSPVSTYLGLFGLGFAVLVVSYVLMYLANRSRIAQLKEMERDERANGYVYYMVGGPEENPAEVHDLTKG